MASEDQAYHQTTVREIEFLDGIVSGLWVRNPSPERAVNALSGYLRTIDARRWDSGVDVQAVRKHAQKQLLLAKMELEDA